MSLACDKAFEIRQRDEAPRVRPAIVRQIALWWQGELDRGLTADEGETPDPPPHTTVTKRFECSEEEALRGVSLGEHRYFSGTE